jgi:hypothetical protein
MANIATVTLTKNTAAVLPAGSPAFKNTVITVTDGAAVVQTATVDGTTESPPWVAIFNNVAAGASTASAQDTAVDGTAIGAAVVASFTETGGTGGTFPQTTAVNVVVS